MDYAGPAASFLQVIGGLAQESAAQSSANAQARALDENARRTLLQGELDVTQVRRDERAATGEMLAGQGGSGLIMGEGSLADMIAQNAYHRELDVMNVRRKATGDAAALTDQAAQARSAGRQAMIGAAFGAVSGALTGVASYRRDKALGTAAAAERAAQLGGGTNLTAQRKPGEQAMPWETGITLPTDIFAVRAPRMRLFD